MSRTAIITSYLSVRSVVRRDSLGDIRKHRDIRHQFPCSLTFVAQVPFQPASAGIDLRPSTLRQHSTIARPRAENTSVSAKLRLMVHSAVRGTIGMPAAPISGGVHASIYALSNRRCSSAVFRGRTHARLSPVGSHLGS